MEDIFKEVFFNNLSFNEEELNTIMEDLKEAPYMRTPGCFGGTPKTFIILKDKIQEEIDRRKKLTEKLKERVNERFR